MYALAQLQWIPIPKLAPNHAGVALIPPAPLGLSSAAALSSVTDPLAQLAE